jgi:hypothetical protein
MTAKYGDAALLWVRACVRIVFLPAYRTHHCALLAHGFPPCCCAACRSLLLRAR